MALPVRPSGSSNAESTKKDAEEESVLPFRRLLKQVAVEHARIEELHATLTRENAFLREQLCCPSERERLNPWEAIVPSEDRPAEERLPSDGLAPGLGPRTRFEKPVMSPPVTAVPLMSAAEKQNDVSDLESRQETPTESGMRSVWENDSNASGAAHRVSDSRFSNHRDLSSRRPSDAAEVQSQASCDSLGLESMGSMARLTSSVPSMPSGMVSAPPISNSEAPPLSEHQIKLLDDLDVMRKTVSMTSASPQPQRARKSWRGEMLNLTTKLQKSGGNTGGNFSGNHGSAMPIVSMCQVWKEEQSLNNPRMSEGPAFPRLQRQDSKALTGEALVGSSIWQSMIMRPNSKKRLMWDLLSISVIFYDVYSIPMEAFQPPQNSVTLVLDWSTTVFWTFDIPITFFSGFYTDWVVELRPTRIAAHYIRTWFGLDFGIVALDWCLLFVTLGSQLDAVGMVRMSKTMRFVRILRAVRLLRVVKLTGAFAEVIEHMRSETLRVLMNIGKLVAFVVIMNHYIACGWYALTNIYAQESNWIKHDQLAHTTIGYRYATALHWSLTQFTPAAMEIYPHNILERVYAILVLLFALVTFSSFVSSITGAMMRFQKISSEPAKQHAILRRYFADNRISVELGNRIWKFLQNKHYAHKKRMHEKDIVVLKLLPQSLKMALHEELYMPIVSVHPFFETYSMVNRNGMREVCNFCLMEHSVNAAQDIFTPGEPGELGNSTMIFITSGVLNYIYGGTEARMVSVEAGGWLCEAALWMSFQHRGKLVANTSCELALLEASKFHSVMSRQKVAVNGPKKYAQTYVGLAQRDWTNFNTCGDIWGDMEDLINISRIAFEGYDLHQTQAPIPRYSMVK